MKLLMVGALMTERCTSHTEFNLQLYIPSHSTCQISVLPTYTRYLLFPAYVKSVYVLRIHSAVTSENQKRLTQARQ